MDRPLYLFNPEHDLALANSDRNFNAPLQAKKLARDLASLPLWYAPAGSIVLNTSPDSNWLEKMQQLFPQLNDSCLTAAPDLSTVTTAHPWGWDNAVCKQLTLLGADDKLLPEESRLNIIRQLSHRHTAIRALQFLQNNDFINSRIPKPALELTSTDEAERYTTKQGKVIFKAPWSGSGKGLCWSRDKMTASRRGWCRNIIEKQGSVIAEPIYGNVQDFAMEFECHDGYASFSGYSLFETERGIYRGNSLASDKKIEEEISTRGIGTQLLHSVRKLLSEFIATEIAPHYSGMLGIDMFVYEENGQRKLHPCVEINLRMTMGCVARIFYDRFVASTATGQFYIDHYPTPGELWADHIQRSKEFPLELTGDRITKGYLALSAITSHSHYRARVEIY